MHDEADYDFDMSVLLRPAPSHAGISLGRCVLGRRPIIYDGHFHGRSAGHGMTDGMTGEACPVFRSGSVVTGCMEDAGLGAGGGGGGQERRLRLSPVCPYVTLVRH